MEKPCIALCKKLLLPFLSLTFVSCFTIKHTVIKKLDSSWPFKNIKYEGNQQLDSLHIYKQNKTNHHSLSNLDSLPQPQYRL
jgi:hypothetical protein